MRFLPATCLLIVAACQQAPQAEQPAAADRGNAPAARPLLAPGEYRLAGADGQDVNLGHAITVTVTDDEIRVFSQCVTPRWTYRYADAKLVTEPVLEPICERGRYPAEEALSAVFDGPESVVRTPENGIYIEGAGHSVTLFSQ